MSDSPHDPRNPRTQREIDDALRRWAARPPVTPAAEAARRIEERLAAEPPRAAARPGSARTIRRLAVAAVLVIAVGLGLILGPYGPGPSPGPGSASGPEPAPPGGVETAPPAPPGDVLVIDLDAETTLYMNLARSRSRPELSGTDRLPEGDPS